MKHWEENSFVSSRGLLFFMFDHDTMLLSITMQCYFRPHTMQCAMFMFDQNAMLGYLVVLYIKSNQVATVNRPN